MHANDFSTTGPTLKVRRFLPWRRNGDEILALDLTAGRMLTIQGMPVELWQALVRGATPAELLESMCAERSTAVAEATQQLNEWIEELTEAGLLEGPSLAA